VETRLYAEDPERGFLPVAGVVHRFRLPEAPGLRVDAGIADGATVSTHYDPLLAKVIAHAPTRGEAIRRLAAALAGMTLHGVGTNRDLLVRILRHPEFLAGATDTRFLERPGLLAAPPPSPELEALDAAAAALAAAAERRATAPALGFVPPAWRNNPATPQHVAFDAGPRRVDVSYGWDRSGLRLVIDGRPVAAQARADAEAVDLEVDGVRRRYRVHRVGRVHYVDGPTGRSELVEIDRFPTAGAGPPGGSLLAPMPGTVLRVAVREGEEVRAGSSIAVLEAMKMEHVVRAPRAGTVRKLCVREGEQVQAGMVLAVIDD
jgi:acetyl/propionyl-CoA carboxylase alpha subunit